MVSEQICSCLIGRAACTCSCDGWKDAPATPSSLPSDDELLEGEGTFLAVMHLVCQVPVAIAVTMVTAPIDAMAKGLRRLRGLAKGFLFPFRC